MENHILSQLHRKDFAQGILDNLGLLILLVLLIIFPTTSNSQNAKTLNINTDTLFTVGQLNEDFALLRKALEEGHAGLYRYTSKEEFDKMFENVEQSLTEPMSEIEFFLKLDPLIANVHCGHTRMGLSSNTTASLNTEPISIPFSLKFVDSKTYLLNNYSEIEDLKMGVEVVSINGNPIDTIVGKMLPLISSDAHIQTSKYQYLKKGNNFSRLYALLYGQCTSFSIFYKSPLNNENETIDVKGISKETMLKIAEDRYPELSKKLPPINISYDNDIAILIIRTFNSGDYSESNISYPEFLKEVFNEFKDKNVKNLIIDLRNNEGGDDEYGKILASYLFDESFSYYSMLEFKKTSYDFLTYTNISSEDWEGFVKGTEKKSNEWYDFIDHPNLGEQKNLNPSFNGKVYILINGNSFSTTGEFTSIIHFKKRAKFIGEECGAAYYGSNSGVIPVLTLPNTKMRISIPLIKYTMAVDSYPTDRGIIPDYPVFTNITDLVNGRDTEMKYVIKLINK